MTTKTPPEHRRVLRRQPGWIRYTVPGYPDVKSYFNGTQDELDRYLESFAMKRERQPELRKLSAQIINPKKFQLRK